ncbi:FAD-dependent thymidylate synthase [Trinickia diaoshuihuensis]|uniref:FAD-dependent thymidylate synthase n=1 Tax=Trinickia diaoshuihuensis TaxID=2292265 RepID=UPI000E221581|nr:FAD-dependent thymidylate synthase [Trinickia diaoshuihuensis]
MKLYLIASSQIAPGIAQYLSDEALSWRQESDVPAAQKLIEFAGRICYMAFGSRQSPRTNKQYVENLIEQGHESVLEHASASLLFTGISRGLSHQLVRHRVGFSYSQLSQQYVGAEESAFAMPPGIGADVEASAIWADAVARSRESYRKLVERLEQSNVGNHLTRKERSRFIRSASRSVLPEATSTALVMTGNMRAWRNFLQARGNIAGDYEMTQACVEVFGLVSAVAPACFGDMQIVENAEGRAYVIKKRDSRL